MKKLLTTLTVLAAFLPAIALAQQTTVQGGTGTSSPSGILYGDGTLHLKSLQLSGLTFSGGTLTSSGGGSSFGYPFPNNATSTQLTFNGGFVTAYATGILHSISGAISSSLISLTADVTGILPIANGGTGSATVSANTIFGNPTGATGAPSFFATSTLFTFSSAFVNTAGVTRSVINPSFTVLGTTTANTITGTTTIPLEVSYGEVWNYVQCSVAPVGATADIAFTWTNNSPTTNTISPIFVASSTVGKMTFTANQTPTTGATTTVSVGTPVGSPTSVNCSVNLTN